MGDLYSLCAIFVIMYFILLQCAHSIEALPFRERKRGRVPFFLECDVGRRCVYRLKGLL